MKKSFFFYSCFILCFYSVLLGIMGKTARAAMLAEIVDLSLLGGVSLNSSTYRDPAYTESRFLAGTYGATIGLHLGRIGIEVGAFDQKRGYRFKNAIQQSDTSVHYLSVPALLRYSLFSRHFSLGFGGYFASTLSSSLNIKTKDLASGVSTSATQARSSMNWGVTDYGLVASLRGNFPITTRFDFIADARYQFGLKNIIQNNTSKLKDILLLAGVSFKF